MLRTFAWLIVLLVVPLFAGRAGAGDAEEDILRALRAKRIMRCPMAESCNQQSSAHALDVTVTFASGSARLDADARSNVQKFAAGYRASGRLAVTLSGYTDAIGGADYNRRLSHRRAAAVRRALTNNGLPAASISAVGYGIRRVGSKTASRDDRIVVMTAAPGS